ncbi:MULTISPECIES: ATP-binding protein [unclassified Bradyrhizobium]|uniref:ATP-binding protein n=1 Tax=unclassified Bradyrhizobium TaxID=2631580 RepID=UPI002303468B|nr:MULTISPECIES: hypothetical protein [unclassified Bradyrhizobium]
MLIVRDHATLEAAIEQSSSETRRCFGDVRLDVERYVESPRHIEVQVLGDYFGNLIPLFERECSGAAPFPRDHRGNAHAGAIAGIADPGLRERSCSSCRMQRA